MQQMMQLIEQSLDRASDAIGDITPAVLERFYGRFPEARAAFELHSRYRPQLEGEMVQEALYCLMRWFESRKEVEIQLSDSVPHHNQTLHVRPEWYAGLLDATAAVIVATIPEHHRAEKDAWTRLLHDLRRVVELGGEVAVP